jgi:hypothetical protein
VKEHMTMNVHALPRPADGHIDGVRAGGTVALRSSTALHDPRWSKVQAALSSLRARGRHAVRVVDAQCGAGSLLLHALHHARALGFTAIEGHGADGSPALIGRARAAANRCVDPAIGTQFDVSDIITALRGEHDLPADIVICHGSAARNRPDVDVALHRAGRIIVDDDAGRQSFGAAA